METAEKRKPGPAPSLPIRVIFRTDAAWLLRVDAFAEQQGIGRSEAIRQLADKALKAE